MLLTVTYFINMLTKVLLMHFIKLTNILLTFIVEK